MLKWIFFDVGSTLVDETEAYDHRVREKKLTPEDKIDLVQGNALDLSHYADKSFDIVLLFGPLYHLKNDADKQKCISEAKRVCKDGGKSSSLLFPTTLFSSPSSDTM